MRSFILLLTLTPSTITAATHNFAPGLHALNMFEDEVEVRQEMAVASIDPEPLFIARDTLTGREAYFRAGEDLCMTKEKIGEFVPCQKWTRTTPIIPPTASPTLTPTPSTFTPNRSTPPPAAPETPTAIPLPPTIGLMLLALLGLLAARLEWFMQDRGNGEHQNGWI